MKSLYRAAISGVVLVCTHMPYCNQDNSSARKYHHRPNLTQMTSAKGKPLRSTLAKSTKQVAGLYFAVNSSKAKLESQPQAGEQTRLNQAVSKLDSSVLDPASSSCRRNSGSSSISSNGGMLRNQPLPAASEKITLKSLAAMSRNRSPFGSIEGRYAK